MMRWRLMAATCLITVAATAAFAAEDETGVGFRGCGPRVGGIETKLKGGSRFLAELQVGVGDVPDIRVLAGWTF